MKVYVLLREILSGTMLVLLLTSMVTLLFNVQQVEASGTVYIRADGSIDPPSAPISTVDNVTYVFTGNVYDEVVVKRSNIIIEGDGYTIQGTFVAGSKGIYLYNVHNVTIKNLNIKRFDYGIRLDHSSNNNIYRNNITANDNGIQLCYSSNNNIYENNIKANNKYGIQLYFSSNNSIYGNSIEANKECGIQLDISSNNNISGNTFFHDGLYVWHSYNNVVADNYVNGKPLVYLEGASNLAVEDAGQVILVNCVNITVEGLNLSSTTVGIQLCRTNNTKIYRNNIEANSQDGIHLFGSSHNNIYRNNIEANDNGIQLCYSSNNNISGNNIEANDWNGILLDSSFHNSIYRNNIENDWSGIQLVISSNNNISGNNITNNWYGIHLFGSSHNSIYHNNFVDNSWQVYDLSWDFPSPPSINVWDNGYPSGGNYWSDCAGVDLFSGPYQNETGCDGIGDISYVIDGNSRDNYPLMGPFNTFDAGVWNGVAYKVDVISNSTVSNFHFIPEEGAFISFNVTGKNGTIGFCRVTVPKSLLWAEEGKWVILVGGEEVNYTLISDENNSYLYFTYQHSTKTVLIQGAYVLPVFYSLTITSTEGGITDPASGTYIYVNDTAVSVRAIPDAGYSFDYWLLDGEENKENPITVIMDSNHSLEAFFVDDIPPEIGDPIQEPPEDVEPYQNVTVTVNVTDLGTGVYNVTLWYSLDNGTTWMPLNMIEISTNTYQAMIPGYENCTWVTYKIIAFDNGGNQATKDNHGYNYIYHVIPELSIMAIFLLFMALTIVAVALTKKR